MTQSEFFQRFYQQQTILSSTAHSHFTWEEFQEIIRDHVLPLEYFPWEVTITFFRLTTITPSSYTISHNSTRFGFRYILDPSGVSPYYSGTHEQKELIWEELDFILIKITHKIVQTIQQHLGSAFSEPRIILKPSDENRPRFIQDIKDFGSNSPLLGDPFAIEIDENLH